MSEIAVPEKFKHLFELINKDFLKNQSFLITGATGLLGAKIVRLLCELNKSDNLNIKIYANVRNLKKAEKLFSQYLNDNLIFIVNDILEMPKTDEKIDYIIHGASNTDSKSFVEKPVETIDVTINGTKNILEFAKNKNIKGMVYLSSMEVYGIFDNEKDSIKENEIGYIDTLSERSSYSLGKRMAECLCYSYFKEYNVPVLIARLCQTIGEEIDYNDNRVFAQFARSVVEKKDIVLHTDGSTTRNYCYIDDAITAIFAILEKGTNGEAYNVANPDAIISIKEMAQILINKCPTSKLSFCMNSENRGYNPISKTILNTEKLEKLDWKAIVGLEEMFDKLIERF